MQEGMGKQGRIDWSMNAEWRFFRGDMEGADQPQFEDSAWEVVHLPHTVRVESAMCSGGVNYQGVAWYRRHFNIEPESIGNKLFIEFEGAKHTAEVWVNGVHMVSHYGGYLPFSIDITDVVVADEDNVMAVRLDNSDAIDIPPGKPQSELDFCYFGGLYRNVWLHQMERLYITDAVHADQVAGGGLFVTYPEVTKEHACIHIQTHVQNDYDHPKEVSLKAILIDHAGLEIAASWSDAQFIAGCAASVYLQALDVQEPKLWHPDHPYLYTLLCEVWGEGRRLDRVQIKIGIRAISFTAEGFAINGEHLVLNGANRHQEYVYVGEALPDTMHRRDAIKLKEAGFNFIRTGHYPQSNAFMNACDELGLMCVVPIPGWQWFRDNQTFKDRSYQNVREMIRRDRNHPCVIFWEPILNETYYNEEYAKNTYLITHEEYPGDSCYAACDSHSQGAQYYDIAYGHVDTVIQENKPLFIREYGDNYREQYGPQKTQNRCSRGNNSFYHGGERAMLRSALERLSYIDQYYGSSRLSGFALWTGIDHNRGYIDNMAATGVFDVYRIPKYAYYMYSSQRDPNTFISGINNEPVLFIASEWNDCRVEQIVVFSNCDSVSLYLNGELLGTNKPDTAYAHVPHPPFIFRGVKYIPGELRAEGSIGGRAVATHTIRTAEEATQLSLVADYCGLHLVADGADLVMIHAYVLDQNGMLATKDERAIAFQVKGAGRIVGDQDLRVGANPIAAEAGAIGVLIQSTTEAGDIIVTASAEGLASASVRLTSIADSKKHVRGPVQQPPAVKPVYQADRVQRYVSVNRKDFNLAYCKPVTASSQQKNAPASSATDGKLNSKWKPSEMSMPQWITIDLEDHYDLTGCKVDWESDHVQYVYRVDVSNDGSEWMEMLQRAGTGQDVRPDTFLAGAIRYVRITILHVTSGTAGIYSIAAYGTKAGEGR
ncbi:glycoside hydrolase family 2 TIM barrel-domain containing protein [Paenibacillus aquistagni]|uniref:Beta-galactosidase n=1 Tax=Paenibacillus aquistagni TaxID=1852522 RepID=A0A1X7LUE3_9BACL|nr:glycoside hydrolase family 2 TIM barrel-domain containing protein [Paenibacillus aquistagni]SMG57516.1 beta-galactosidase [Paenibacillus aquistagni]